MFWSKKEKSRKPAKKPRVPWTETLKRIIDEFGTARQKATRGRHGSIKPEVLKGFVAPTVYVMIADEKRQDQEEILLLSMLMSSPVLKGQTTDDLGRLVDDIEHELPELYSGKFGEKMQEMIGPLPQELRLASYAYAVRMVYADQHKAPEEESALNDLAKWLEISRADSAVIQRVMQMLVQAPPIT